ERRTRLRRTTSTRSMRGECSGKVRSTPTPYEMRRTVNDARPPSPRRRIPIPSKGVVRSFSPSMTFTCTRTVSPAVNPARSFLSCTASTSRIASMTAFPFVGYVSVRGVVELLRRLPALESFHQPALVVRQRRCRQQVPPLAPREPDGLHPAPPRDARVIAGQQHRWYPRALVILGPRVLRRLQQPVRKRLAARGALGPEHPRQQPRHRVGDHQRRQLAAGHDVVADRHHVVGQLSAAARAY